MKWYVLQVYAGYEPAVKAGLHKRIKEQGLEDLFGEILVPTAQQKKYFSSDEEKDQQLFPGYVLIEMNIVPESTRLVLSGPRILRFLGGKDPASLSKKEVDRVLSQIKGDIIVGAKKEEFIIGSEVEIEDGPFSGFVGLVDKVESGTEKLTIMVSIFGRMTPVEIGFHQVKR